MVAVKMMLYLVSIQIYLQLIDKVTSVITLTNFIKNVKEESLKGKYLNQIGENEERKKKDLKKTERKGEEIKFKKKLKFFKTAVIKG